MEQDKQKKSSRKVREGVVVSNRMEKTITVRVERTLKHPRFDKVVSHAKKYYVHAENSKDIPQGKKVRIIETRPISKLKRWRLQGVLE